MKLALWGGVALASVMAAGAQAQTTVPAPAPAGAHAGNWAFGDRYPDAVHGLPSPLSRRADEGADVLSGHRQRAVRHQRADQTKLSQAGTPVTLGTSREADGTMMGPSARYGERHDAGAGHLLGVGQRCDKPASR